MLYASLKKKGEFLESAEIFGNQYGTKKKFIEDAVRKGKAAVLTIDVEGARSVKKTLKGKIPFFSIFILPPSMSALRERLEGRSTDSPEEIEKRIQRAEEEIKEARDYHGTVINHDLDQTVHEIEDLIENFKKKLERRK